MKKENAILKIKIPFEYNKIVESLNKQDLKVIKTIMYVDENSISHFDLVDITDKYVIFVIIGEDINEKLQIIKNNMQDLNLYFSTNESYIKDFELYVKNSILNEETKKISFEEVDEKTLAVISPSGYKNVNAILKIIKSTGLNIDDFKITELTSEIKDKYNIIDESGNVMFLVLRGYQAVNRLKAIVGSYGVEDTIKDKYGEDSITCSETIDEAQIDIEKVFKAKTKTLKKGF